MHELGVVIKVARTVENFAKNNGITKIDTLVLQIGELSSMIPKYIEACYPAAVDGTILEDTKLEIEILPGEGKCNKCYEEFNLNQYNRQCPDCGSGDWEVLSGREFLIKEIIAC